MTVRLLRPHGQTEQAPEAQLKVFNPFYQEEGLFSREHGGVGLGLSICKGIIESIGGRIWFESKKGSGSTFYFSVPTNPKKDLPRVNVILSQSHDFENKLKAILLEEIGPLAGSEIKLLAAEGLSENNVIEYIEGLERKKIYTGNLAEFKNKVRQLFKEARSV